MGKRMFDWIRKNFFKIPRVMVMRGDIVQIAKNDPKGVLVNAANQIMLGGGGVDGAIHRAAGPLLLQECSSIKPNDRGYRVDLGQCRITGSYAIGCQAIIHTVGPDCRESCQNKHRENLLYMAYHNCMCAAFELGAERIYFPAISTGIYGYPLQEASRVAVSAISRYLRMNKKVKLQVILVAYDELTTSILKDELNNWKME